MNHFELRNQKGNLINIIYDVQYVPILEIIAGGINHLRNVPAAVLCVEENLQVNQTGRNI